MQHFRPALSVILPSPCLPHPLASVDKRLLHQGLDLLSALEAALNSGTLLCTPPSREVNQEGACGCGCGCVHSGNSSLLYSLDMPTPTPSDPGEMTTPSAEYCPARADSGHVALPEGDDIMDR